MLNALISRDMREIENKAEIHPYEAQIKTLETYQAMLLEIVIGHVLNACIYTGSLECFHYLNYCKRFQIIG